MSIDSAHTQWYRCESRIGELAVGIDTGATQLPEMQGPGLLLQQATLLSEVELTLQAFELWQDVDLDLEPLTDEAAKRKTATGLQDNEIELLITHDSLAGYLPTRFRFSKQSLPRLQAVDDLLAQSLKLEWSSLPVAVTLDYLNLAENEIEKISTGATILLPASFTAPWQASVDVPGIAGLSFSARLDPVKKQITLCPPTAKTGEDMSQYQTTVRLADLHSVSPAEVMGNVDGKTIGLSCGSAALTALVEVNGTLLAMGSIGEVGRGFAVHVSSMLTED